ncbi:MAG: phosphomannomutase/phosphoglucomutase [Pseudomonadales bacterium]|nr:phosphomannomutase/phosphoglucomutase [Pseudomonadales bacterium]
MSTSPHSIESFANEAPVDIPAAIFRAYDIRGIAFEQLSEASVRLISQAIGSEARAQGINTLYVGYDGRLSSPVLSSALIAGLRDSGCSVVSLGLIPTPLLYFATHTTEINSGVMLTASHNPANYNGLKVVFNKDCLADDQIQNIRKRAATSDLTSGHGDLRQTDIVAQYVEDICQRIELVKPLRLVIDCGNAVPATIAPDLFQRLGCEVIPLYCEIDGNFPNHHPDPTIGENLRDLSKAVKDNLADLGIAFDGDGDRLGVVTNLGEEVNADKMLMLLTEALAQNYPGEAVVFDVKCSQSLQKLIVDSGMQPVMHRSGHSFMKQKMKETNAPIGGEYAAHIFFKDRWFGFDDGLYAAARIVEILSQREQTSAEVFARYHVPFSTPEIKLSVPEEQKFELMRRILALADFPDEQCITLDGLRVEFENGWGLVRASNTSPALLLRFEAETEEALEQIRSRFKALIHAADNSIEFSF